MDIDEVLNRFEDEDGDGIPDWVEVLGIISLTLASVALFVGAVSFGAWVFW